MIGRDNVFGRKLLITPPVNNSNFIASYSSYLTSCRFFLQSRIIRTRIAELEGWTAELDKAKENLLGEIVQKDARIAELEGWTAELEKAKTYHEEQLTAKDARIAELESWTAEQDKAKEWFLGQLKQKDARIAALEKEREALRKKK